MTPATPPSGEHEPRRDDAGDPSVGVVRGVQLQRDEQLQRRELHGPQRQPGEREQDEPLRPDASGGGVHDRASSMRVRYQSNDAFGVRSPVVVVDVDESESLGEALGPLEVVQQRPHGVLLDRHAALARTPDGRDVTGEVRDALGIDERSGDGVGLREGRAVLGRR